MDKYRQYACHSFAIAKLCAMEVHVLTGLC